MSHSESTAAATFQDLASEIAARCADAVEADRLDDIPDESLGQIMAAAVRVLAAKAQAGSTPKAFGRNSGVTVTDVAIGCTAMMDAVALSVFELGGWQALAGIGRDQSH